VASYYAPDGKIAINGGDEIVGRAAATEMAAGFYAEFPDLIVHLDDIRAAGNQAIFVWTLEGTMPGPATGSRCRAGKNGPCLTTAWWRRRLDGLMQ